jgi:hypothetical protein
MTDQTRAILVAAALSPLAAIPATIPVALLTLVESKMTGRSESLSGVASAFLVTSSFGVPIAYVCMVVVGLPAAALALRVRSPSFLVAAVVGVLTGLSVWFLLGGRGTIYDVRSGVMLSYYGIVVSAAFVAVFRKAALRSEGA